MRPSEADGTYGRMVAARLVHSPEMYQTFPQRDRFLLSSQSS